MGFYYYGLFSIFAIVVVLMIVDPNVGLYIDLIYKNVSVQFRRLKWVLFNHPDNPFVRWMIWRRSYKIAEQLRKEMEDRGNV
jgi:hypothetical protein